MKLFILLPAAFLAACSPNEKPPTQTLANPASTHCIDIGGTLKIMTEADGQVGYCHLPSGEVIEEWALFKRDTKKAKE